MPPFTVASLHTTMHSMPAMRPMPVTSPADGTSPPYMSWAAKSPTSRNGDPGSRSRLNRSRGRSFPRSRWRVRACAGPPCMILAAIPDVSSMRRCIRSRLDRYASERIESDDSRMLIVIMIPHPNLRQQPERPPGRPEPRAAAAGVCFLMIGHWTEYAIVLLMFVTIVGFGFLESSVVRVMRLRREAPSGRMQPRSPRWRTNRAG